MRYGRKHTGALNVEEINIMSGGVDHGPESHGVRDLSVEPDVLVGGEKPCHAGADNTDDVSQHGDENEAPVKGKNEPSSSRRPDRPCQPVQGGQLLVSCLSEGGGFVRRGTGEEWDDGHDCTNHTRRRKGGCHRR